jgi:hypothetical protein
MNGIKTYLLKDRSYQLWARRARQSHYDRDFKAFEQYFCKILHLYREAATKQKITHHNIDMISVFWGSALHLPWERIVYWLWYLFLCVMIFKYQDDGYNTQRFLYLSALALMLLSSTPQYSLPALSAQRLRGKPWTEGFAATLFAAGQIVLQLALAMETFDSPQFTWTNPPVKFYLFVWVKAAAFSLMAIINGCNTVNFARLLQEGRKPRVDGVDISVEDWLVYELLLSDEGQKQQAVHGTVLYKKVNQGYWFATETFE